MGDLIGYVQAHWEVILPVVVAVSSLLAAVLPQGQPGGVLDLFRKLLNYLALNKRNARNADTNGA